MGNFPSLTDSPEGKVQPFDDDPNEAEDRWITIGRAGPNRLLLVVHTHVEITADRIAIRIISARHPTRRETRRYEDGL